MSGAPERVMRYNVSGTGSAPNATGMWCRSSDVDIIESRLREVKAERDALAHQLERRADGMDDLTQALRADREALVQGIENHLSVYDSIAERLYGKRAHQSGAWLEDARFEALRAVLARLATTKEGT